MIGRILIWTLSVGAGAVLGIGGPLARSAIQLVLKLALILKRPLLILVGPLLVVVVGALVLPLFLPLLARRLALPGKSRRFSRCTFALTEGA